MTAQPVEPYSPYNLPITNLRELRTALGALATLGVPTELDSFEARLAETPLDQVPALIDRYREYYRRNTTPEALAALTMSSGEFEQQLRRKMAEDSR